MKITIEMNFLKARGDVFAAGFRGKYTLGHDKPNALFLYCIHSLW